MAVRRLTATAASHDVRNLFHLLQRADGFFDSVDGDPVDILSHSLQCAHELAESAPDDLELQVAGLVHDLGHVIAPGDAPGHGRAGADLVRPLLGDRVARLVELHVPAKRYLVTTDPEYRRTLSSGSVASLRQQGGGLEDHERSALEAEPHLGDALTLRRADEAAKVVGREVPGLGRWRPVVERLASAG